MLKLKYLFENFDLAKECLALYDYDEPTLDEMLSHYRIASNAVYPFRAGGEIRFLRLSPAQEKPIADVQSEIRLIQWLIDNGFPAMRPVPMKDGRLAGVIATKWGDYNVSCFARVKGEALDDAGEGGFALVRGYGRSMGRLHGLLKRYPAADERRDWRGLLLEIRGRMEKCGASARMMKELADVEKALAALPATQDNYGVVHFDYEPDNVFYDGETGDYSAIDFDDAIRCWFALDIVRAIDALDDVVAEDLLERAEAELLAGYREACPLSDEDEQTLPLMRRFVLLKKYSTLLYVMSEPTAEEPDWLISLKERLTEALNWIESTVEP